jgi:hypothetical protein
VILRLVFLLYAEERDMLPEDDTFLRYYSLAGLYERLREDAALFPDTMDQRYGAWAQLLVLFRMVHDGAESGFAMVRMMSGGGRFMCRGPHHDDREETARLRRELEELREQMKKQGAAG